jgi:hypothetical protein
VHARGHLHLDAAPARIDDLRLGTVARFTGSGEPVPFTAGLAGQLRVDDGLRLHPAGIVLRGGDIVPTLDAGGRVAWNDRLAFELDGALARWPGAWPALPAPLGRPRTPVPISLTYAGPIDLSGASALRARHADTSVDVAFVLPILLAWNDARDAGSPLPPLTGALRTRRIEIAGATLEGVELVIEDDPLDADALAPPGAAQGATASGLQALPSREAAPAEVKARSRASDAREYPRSPHEPVDAH